MRQTLHRVRARVKYTVIDNCIVPRGLARKIRVLKRDVPGAILLSCYRGEEARHLLHRLGKHTQSELFNAWLRRAPGANPANPPGRSTHELRSDAVAYPHHPLGSRLPFWCVGMDWTDQHVPALIRAAARRGWQLHRPYSSGSEFHHLNFRRRPR